MNSDLFAIEDKMSLKRLMTQMKYSENKKCQCWIVFVMILLYSLCLIIHLELSKEQLPSQHPSLFISECEGRQHKQYITESSHILRVRNFDKNARINRV